MSGGGVRVRESQHKGVEVAKKRGRVRRFLGTKGKKG